MKKTEDSVNLRVLHIASWYPSKEHGSLGNFIQRHVGAVAKKHESEVWYAAPVSNESPLLGTSEVIQRDGFLEHWTAYHDSQHIPLWRKISMRRTAAYASAFCPVTDQLGEKMREFKMLNRKGNSVYTTVPNVVDTEMFTMTSANEVKGEAVRLLHVSSLDESQKNITGILHTLATLRRSQPEFKFCATFVGGNDSEKLGKLRTYSASLGLTETCVTFTGPLSSEEVAKCMQSADALVLFSRNENFPCVIAEAWASGVPVISTDVGGISEHLVEESGRGILIQSEDESGLREAILSLGDGAKFNSVEIRKYATKHFSVEAISEAFDKVYREALKSGAE